MNVQSVFVQSGNILPTIETKKHRHQKKEVRKREFFSVPFGTIEEKGSRLKFCLSFFIFIFLPLPHFELECFLCGN